MQVLEKAIYVRGLLGAVGHSFIKDCTAYGFLGYSNRNLVLVSILARWHSAVAGLFASSPNFMTGWLSKHKHSGHHLGRKEKSNFFSRSPKVLGLRDRPEATCTSNHFFSCVRQTCSQFSCSLHHNVTTVALNHHKKCIIQKNAATTWLKF